MRTTRKPRKIPPRSAARRVLRTGARRGFALIVTITILVLLALVAVGLLTLSTIQVRSVASGAAQAEARANARLAMMLAIGELQKSLGADQNVCAPSAILDANPGTSEPDGLRNPFLTGAWQGRNDPLRQGARDRLEDPPSYDRDAPFKTWLVSNKDREALKQLSFAPSGTVQDPVVLVETPAPAGVTPATKEVLAGKVPLVNGSYAWWVGDENCKALLNPRDRLAREEDPATADLLASFATPGAHGVQAVPGYETFPANTATTDKLITRDTHDLSPPPGTRPAELFHDLSPYPESVLANVAGGGLRKDLTLYLERRDIDWLAGWGRFEGRGRPPRGPLGPNDEIALSPPNEFDVLSWKSLHHHYMMHRQTDARRRIVMNALDGTTRTPDPISNPYWNSGVSMPTPVVVRMQILVSYGLKKKGEEAYDISFYSYPVVTLWNPWNVRLQVREYSVFLHTIPLEHKIMLNSVEKLGYKWEWSNEQKSGNMVMRLGSPGVTIDPGGTVSLYYETAKRGSFGAHDMTTRRKPFRPDHAGLERPLGTISGVKPIDRLSIETKDADWLTSGTSFGPFETTFGYRCQARERHEQGYHDDRFQRQMFSGQVCWRREPGNPSSDTLSENNFPSRAIRDLVDAPTPFLHLDVRLKTLDEIQLPVKTWLHTIPSLPFAASTSTAKHSRQGVDAATTFFAHPYTATFEQKTTIEGLFQTTPYFGSSNTPEGQSYITDREVPMAPLTSLAQLQNLPQYPMEGLNWSNYHLQNHAIGNSYASPGLASDQIKRRSFPFYLGQYFPWQGGDLAGKLYPDTKMFNNDRNGGYEIEGARAAIIDRSYAANHLLWDDYFFSSMAAQDGDYFRYYGERRRIGDVIREFYDGTRDLPNPSYRPHLPGGISAGEAIDALVGPTGGVIADAHQKAAAQLMVKGGFNVNSTSVAAWTAMLGSSHLKRPVILDAEGRGALQAEPEGRYVVSRFTVPNGGAVTATGGDEDLAWRGYRELTEEDIRELAEAIVRQVKMRGPFRSLGEFINRRLGDPGDETSLYGALQAALEDPEVGINENYKGGDRMITPADIALTNYKFPEAALGSRFQGSPAYISQADILMPLAPVINARSDTFLIRGYGEAVSPDGKTVLAKAWCEAVVQRHPEFLDPADPPETPLADLQSEANKVFGRRFTITNFRWLSEAEIETVES